MNLKINNNEMTEKKSVKNVGIIMDCNLNWKDHVFELRKKISRGIGIQFKLRDFVSTGIMTQVYYSLIYPFLCCPCMGAYIHKQSASVSDFTKESYEDNDFFWFS